MGTLSVKNSTVLNRLGPSAIVSLYYGPDHFISIAPNRELVHHTLDVIRVIIDRPGESQVLYEAPEIEPLPGFVYSFERGNGDPLLVIYPTDDQAPAGAPTKEIILKAIGKPEEPVDHSHVYVFAETEIAFNKLSRAGEHQVLTGKPFPRAALRTILESQPELPSQYPSAAIGASDDAPAKEDRFDLLLKGLNSSANPPATQVENGHVPAPPATTVKPPVNDDVVIQRYELTQSIQGLVNLYFNIARAAKMAKEGRTELYKTTDPVQANLAFEENANLTANVMSTNLAGYLESPKFFTNNYEKEVAKNEFKTVFTKDIFSGFRLGDNALEEIASFIQNYLSAIGNIKTKSSSVTNVRSFCNSVNTVVKIDVLSDGQHIVYQPRVHLVYMKIDHEAYKVASKTCFSETDTERFKFYMTYTVIQADVNYNQMVENKQKLDGMFINLSTQNLNQPKQTLNEFSKQPGISQEAQNDIF